MNKSKNATLIFIITYLAYTAIYVARLNLSMAASPLEEMGHLTTAQIGLLGSIFSVIYSVGRLINGGISDRVPPFIMICTGLTLTGAANIILSFLPPFTGMLILWAVNAFSQSMLWSSVLCVIADTYDISIAKHMTSRIVTSVAVGNIIGILFNIWLIDRFGTKFAFLIPGLIVLVIAPIIFAFIRKIPAPSKSAKKHISMFSLIKSKEIGNHIAPAMFHGVMKENISLWMAVYFVSAFGINLKDSGLYILFIPIVGFIGRAIYGIFLKLCKQNEHRVSVVFFIVCAISSLPLVFGGGTPVIAAVALSVIYASVSVINTSILSIYPMHFAKSGNVASVSGIMDFATYLGGGIGSAIYGIVIEKFGYGAMFSSWTIMSVVSVIMLWHVSFKKQA